MKKRLLSAILVLCLIICLFPVSAFAVTDYGIWIADEQITSSNTWSREGWEYDAGSNTLTLRGYSMATIGKRINADDETPKRFAIIYVEGNKDLKINITGNVQLGDSSFSSEASRNKYNESYSGIYAPDANITITGDGLLNIVTHEVALYAKNLTIAMTAQAQRTVSCESYGTSVIVMENLVVKDNSAIVAYTNNAWKGMGGLTVGKDLRVDGANAKAHGVATLQDSSQKSYSPAMADDYQSFYLCGITVGECIYADGGVVDGKCNKKVVNDSFGTAGIRTKKISIFNNATVNAFIDNPFPRGYLEYGMFVRGFSGAPDPESYGLWFDGAGKLCAGVKNIYAEDNDTEGAWETVYYTLPMNVKPGIKMKHFRTNSGDTGYRIYNEYSTEILENIYVKYDESAEGSRKGRWSYFSDFHDSTSFYWEDGLKLNDVYDVAFKTELPLDVVVLSDGLTLDVNLDEGRKIPKIILKNGANAKIKMDTDKTYYFDNPIELSGGSLELTDGARARGLDITGTGKTVIKGGNFSGKLGDNIILQITGGSADFNDNGKAVDGDGNTVHKYSYVVEGVNENKYVGRAPTRQPPYDTYYGYENTGSLHEGDMLHYWLRAQDSIYGVYLFPRNEDGRLGDGVFYNLIYGTNILAHRLPFMPIKLKYFVIKDNDSITMSTMTNAPSDLQEKDVLLEWFLVNGENETSIGSRTREVNYTRTAASLRNGQHYRAKVSYGGWDSKFSVSYTYNAYVFIDNPSFTAPDKFNLGKTAKFEVTNNTPASDAAVTLHYLWEASGDGGRTFTPIEGATSSVYEPTIEISMNGRQIRCKTWVTTGDGQSTEPTVFGPVTISFPEAPPVITVQPKDIAVEAPEQPKPATKPGEITIVFDRTAFFSIQAAGTDLKYQWQESTDGGKTFTDILGGDDSSIGIYARSYNNGKLIRCVVSNEYGSVISNTVLMTVYYQPQFKFGGVISNATVNVGENATFTTSITEGNPGGVEVTWQVSSDGGETYTDVTESDGTVSLLSEVVNGEKIWTTTFVTCKATTALNGNLYRCIAKNAQNDDYVGTWRSEAATLTVKSYTVSFDTNGGSEIGSKIIGWNDKVLEGVTAPTKNGYDFTGWKYGDKTVAADTVYSELVADDSVNRITLTAQWSEKSGFTVRFDSDGGSKVADKTNVKWNDSVFEGVVNPSKNGYNFIGWTYNEMILTADTFYSDLAKDDNVESVTLKALWRKKDGFTVRFDTDGGSKVADKTNVKWTDRVLEGIDAPVKNTYDFTGWKYGNKNVTADTVYSELAIDDSVTSITLTAQWLDIEKPSGNIIVGTNIWNKFLNVITFGLFFKKTQTVTIEANDNSADQVKIEYLLSGVVLTENKLANKTFTLYSGSFNIDPDNEYIIYVRLTDAAGNVQYICSNGIVLDGTAPVIDGVENLKTYCKAQTVTITENYLMAVKVNGTGIDLDGHGSFVLSPANGQQTITVTDNAGNETTIIVTVNDGHTFDKWSSNGGGTHTRKCTVEGCVDGLETDNCADTDNDHKCDECGATLSEHTDTDNNHICDICGEVISDHTGGEATCVKKPVCDTCGNEYGDIDSDNHKGLKHVEKVDATKEKEGNIEYWYCEDCGKYFGGENGTKEIEKKDTVIAKLEDGSKSPQTGETGSIALWIALLFISGGICTCISVILRKKALR